MFNATIKTRAAAMAGAAVTIATLLAGCASTSATGEYNRSYDFGQIERVAVSSIQGAGGNEAAQEQVGAMFTERMLALGLDPVERTRVREVMDEQDFAQSDATRAEGAAALGRILNVDAMFLIDVPQYSGDMSISARMVDTETARVLWSSSGSGSQGAGGAVGALAGGLAGGAAGTSGGRTGQIVGAGAGAMGGKLAGDRLTPEQQELAADLIIEITDTLPPMGR